MITFDGVLGFFLIILVFARLFVAACISIKTGVNGLMNKIKCLMNG